MYPSPDQSPPDNYANIPSFAQPAIPQAPLSSDYGNIPNFDAMPNEAALDANLSEQLSSAIDAVDEPSRAEQAEPMSPMERGAQPGFLPDYQPRNAPPRSPYGVPIRVAPAEGMMREASPGGTLPAFDPKNAPKAPPMAPIPQIPKNAAPSRREPGADEIVVETPRPFKDNERSVSALPERATFKGHIMAKRQDGGLILKNAEQGRMGELIHLPASATAKLESKNGGEMIRKSMENGNDGAPLQISHFKGKWSVAPTNNHALRK